MNKLIEELKWRGMLQDIMPGTEEQLNKGMTTAYIGFDPTAESLHIGGMVQILLLVHLQKAGHKPQRIDGKCLQHVQRGKLVSEVRRIEAAAEEGHSHAVLSIAK